MQSQNINFEHDDFNNNEIETETTTTTTTTNDDDSLSNTKEEEEEEEEEEVIPLMSEELDVTKRVIVDETVITKKPVKETKTVEVQLIREGIESFERRPPSSQTKAQDPVQSPKDIKIPLKREEPEVTKKSYAKEEVVVVKKKTVTDKKEIIDEVTSEELVDTSNIDR